MKFNSFLTLILGGLSGYFYASGMPQAAGVCMLVGFGIAVLSATSP